ncbi:hypothetical protein [Tessaracoccus coleopterorum]|nr:hypothetical protein [Tessaracoccus coleopterorum]
MIERARAQLLTDDPSQDALNDLRALVAESWRRASAGGIRVDALPRST